MRNKFKAALAAAKKTAGRELGLFVFMVVFSLAAAVIAIPLIFVLAYLPDWAWAVFLACVLVWIVLGDTISAAVSAYRGEKP